MGRIRKTQAALNLPTVKLEGGLFLPDQLEKAGTGSKRRTRLEADYGTPKGVKLKDEYSRVDQSSSMAALAAQMERADVDATTHHRLHPRTAARRLRLRHLVNRSGSASR